MEGRWNGEGRKNFKEEVGEVKIENEEVQMEWEKMEGKVRKTVEKVESERRMEGKGKRRGRWDEECREAKRGVRKRLREWRKSRKQGQEYKKSKREYRELCERKKREETEEWARKAENRRAGMGDNK